MGREHPIQFRNGVGSEYKHKGFITGRSLLKAGANSHSSSKKGENSREEGAGGGGEGGADMEITKGKR